MTVDHVVLATPDLPATAAQIGRLTGVSPVAGGSHPGAGTRNFLLGLGGHAYLEIIGVDPEQPAPRSPRPFELDSLVAPVVVTWALRVSDIERRVEGARRLGVDPGDVLTKSRVTPDGQRVTGRITPPAATPERGLLPFLIEWVDGAPPHRTLPQAELLSLIAVHPEPDPVRHGLRALGAEVGVRGGLGTALVVTLRGRAGTAVLW